MAATASTEPASRVDSHLTCIKCGYDLYALTTDGLCPECAHSVRLSLKEHARFLLEEDRPLQQCNREWLGTMIRGIDLIFVAAAIALVAGWCGFGLWMQGFWYGCLAIPPWPIAALGVWKITKVEPGAVQRPRNLQRWLVRSATIFFVFLPIFMIRPGYVGFGARLLGDDWSPISQLALNAGIFAPIATAILAFRCAHLSKRAGIAFLQVQFYLLLLLWTPLMLYTGLEVLSYSDRYYSPLIFFYDEGGAAGVGHLGLLAPLAFGRESSDWPVWADVFVGCWFLVMLLALRGVLKSAKALGSGTARANDQPKPTEGCSNLSPP